MANDDQITALDNPAEKSPNIGSNIPRQTPSLETDPPIEAEGSPVDIIAGGIGSKLAESVGPTITDAIASGISHAEFGNLVGNEIGAIGNSVKPIFTTVEAGEAPAAKGAIQRLEDKFGSVDINQGGLTQKELNAAMQKVNRPKNYAEGGEVGSEPAGMDEFINSPDSGTVSDEVPAPEGLDKFLEPELKEDKYGSVSQLAKTALEGGAQGVIGPLAPAIEKSLGVNEEDIRGRAEANPLTHAGSEIAGLIAPLAASGGANLLGKAGLEGAAEVLPKIAKFSQLGALDAIQAKLGLVAGESLASKIGTGAAKAAIDNMLIAGSDETSKMILNDPNQSAQTAMTDIGLSGVLGAALGGGATGVGALWKDTVGDKAGKLVSDFRGRMQEHMDNPDPVNAMTKELTDYHKDVSGIADEVYGPQGLKAQGIAKSMPEMHEGINTQAQETYDKLDTAVKKMAKNPEAYPARLTQKLQGDLDAFANKVSTDGAGPNDIFNATQDLKQSMQGYAKYDKFVKPVDEAYDFVRDAKSMARDLRMSLEDTDVWGKAAERQQKINEAFSEYLPSLKDFEKKFTSEVAGEKAIDPGKISTYLSQVGKPNATIKQTMLKNFLDASEKYKRVIDKVHQSLEIESPVKNTPMNVTMSSLGKKTLGSKLADAFINKGLTETGSSGLGGVTGATLAHLTGLNGAVGAIIGQQALGPFFKSVLPAITKSLMTREAASQGFKAAADYGASVVKGENLLSKATANLFKADTDVIPESMKPTEKDRIKLNKQLDQIRQNPDLLLNKDNHLSGYMPEHALAMDETTGNAVNYLNSIRPMTDRQAPLDSKPVASNTEKEHYTAALDLAVQPTMILDKIKKGTLTTRDLSIVSALYPRLLDNMRQKLTDAMVSHLSDGGMVPYRTRMGMSMLMGQPLDSTMMPSHIQAAQIFGPQQSPQQSPQKPKRRTASSPALQKMPSMYQTPAQSRTLRQNKL